MDVTIDCTDDAHFERACAIRRAELAQSAMINPLLEIETRILKEFGDCCALRDKLFFDNCNADDLGHAMDRADAAWAESHARIRQFEQMLEDRSRQLRARPEVRFTKRLIPFTSAFEPASEVPSSRIVSPSPDAWVAYVTDKYLATVRTVGASSGLLLAELWNRDSGAIVSSQRGVGLDEIFVLNGDRIDVQTRAPLTSTYHDVEAQAALPFFDLHCCPTEIRVHCPSSGRYWLIRIANGAVLDSGALADFVLPRNGRHYLRVGASSAGPAVLVRVPA